MCLSMCLSYTQLGLPSWFRLSYPALVLRLTSYFYKPNYAFGVFVLLISRRLQLPAFFALLVPPPLPLPTPLPIDLLGLGLYLRLTPYSYILFLYALRTRHPTPPTRFALMALYDARASRYATALLLLWSKARTLYIL